MKKAFVSLFLLGTFTSSYSQYVGINTETPKATLDIQGKPEDKSSLDGIIAPRITGDQLANKNYTLEQKGTLVYITEKIGNTISNSQVMDILSEGYYYFDGSKWKKIGSENNKEQFYMPTFTLPTTSSKVSTNPNDDISYSSSTEKFTVNLYSIYEKQFSTRGNTPNNSITSISSSTNSSLKKYGKEELEYFIIYFDNTVFDPETITITPEGILSYKIKSANVTDKTYMNIILKVK